MPVSPADARAGSFPLGSRACMSHVQAARGYWAQAPSRGGVWARSACVGRLTTAGRRNERPTLCG